MAFGKIFSHLFSRLECLSRTKREAKQRELSNRASSHRQKGKLIRRNCPIERLSRTKSQVNP